MDGLNLSFLKKETDLDIHITIVTFFYETVSLEQL